MKQDIQRSKIQFSGRLQCFKNWSQKSRTSSHEITTNPRSMNTKFRPWTNSFKHPFRPQLNPKIVPTELKSPEICILVIKTTEKATSKLLQNSIYASQRLVSFQFRPPDADQMPPELEYSSRPSIKHLWCPASSYNNRLSYSYLRSVRPALAQQPRRDSPKRDAAKPLDVPFRFERPWPPPLATGPEFSSRTKNNNLGRWPQKELRIYGPVRNSLRMGILRSKRLVGLLPLFPEDSDARLRERGRWPVEWSFWGPLSGLISPVIDPVIGDPFGD